MNSLATKVRKGIKKCLKINNIENHPFFNKLNNVRWRFNSRGTRKEIEHRKNIDIFNYKELAKPLKYYPFFEIQENNMYGNGRIIFPNTDLSKEQINKTRIEHGLYLGNLVHSIYKDPIYETIITFSNYRKCILKNEMDKTILCVGPYIKYANLLLSDEMYNKIKKEIGRVLLVFPAHSIETVSSVFDMDNFISVIEKKKHSFNTIIICLFWKDILLGKAEKFIKKGYKVVTAGHIYDYYFLDRLKTIISLADFTLSNSIGTHIGYCIYMGKPHYIFKGNVKYVEAGDDKRGSERELNQRQGSVLESFNQVKEEIYNCFSNEGNEITKEQINCIKKYWGNF